MKAVILIGMGMGADMVGSHLRMPGLLGIEFEVLCRGVSRAKIYVKSRPITRAQTKDAGEDRKKMFYSGRPQTGY
jgi:hypothetical protein